MQKKYLIIGSNSFTGASHCKLLLESGKLVIGVSRSKEPNDVFLPYKWLTKEQQKNFSFYQVDLNNDLDLFFEILKREKPSVIVNFAAQSMVGESWDAPDDWIRTNVLSMAKMINGLKQLDFIDRFIQITTPEVYGSTNGWVKEGAEFNPTTPYALSRMSGDLICKIYQEAYDLPIIFTRAANVYGPGQPLYRIIPRTILFMLLGKKLQLHGGGSSSRSFIHVDDVCAATNVISESGVIGETYHISTNSVVTIKELVQQLCNQLGVEYSSSVEEVGERLGKDAAYYLDSTKLRNQLGWRDLIDLNSGISQTIEWVQANKDALRLEQYDYVHKK